MKKEEEETDYCFAVDVPRADITNDEWITVKMFKTEKKAIAYAMTHFNADSEGKISLISSF